MSFLRYSGAIILSLAALLALLLLDLSYPLGSIALTGMRFAGISPHFDYAPWIAPVLALILFGLVFAVCTLSFMRDVKPGRRFLLTAAAYSALMVPYLIVRASWNVADHPELLYVREGHCQSPLVSRLGRIIIPFLSPQVEYFQFSFSDACRAFQFKDVFFEHRAGLCPQLGPEHEIACLKEWTDRLSKKAPFTATAQLIMLWSAVNLMIEKKNEGVGQIRLTWDMGVLAYLNIEALTHPYRHADLHGTQPDIDLLEESVLRSIQFSAVSRASEIFTKAGTVESKTYQKRLNGILDYWRRRDPAMAHDWEEGRKRNPSFFDGENPVTSKKGVTDHH